MLFLALALVALKDKVSVLGHGLGLEGLGLGPVLGLELQVLGPCLGLEPRVLVNITENGPFCVDWAVSGQFSSLSHPSHSRPSRNYPAVRLRLSRWSRPNEEPTRKPRQSYRRAYPRRVTLTSDLLTSESTHAERLPRSIRVLSLVLVDQSVFLLERGHTDTVKDATDYSTLARLPTAWVMNGCHKNWYTNGQLLEIVNRVFKSFVFLLIISTSFW